MKRRSYQHAQRYMDTTFKVSQRRQRPYTGCHEIGIIDRDTCRVTKADTDPGETRCDIHAKIRNGHEPKSTRRGCRMDARHLWLRAWNLPPEDADDRRVMNRQAHQNLLHPPRMFWQSELEGTMTCFETQRRRHGKNTPNLQEIGRVSPP